MTGEKVLLIDSTLRDGSHAIKHQLNIKQITDYCAAADKAKMPIVMVGHGNGLGASSLQVGLSLLPDIDMITAARAQLKNSKLGVFIIPGFGTIHRDLSKAIDAGADVVCVSSHCTETDTTQMHIKYVRERGKEVYSNLMMTHMASKEVLVEEGLKCQSYGSQGVILMDSAGAYLPEDVTDKISALVKAIKIPVGFHAHNNLGLAVGNSLAAVQAGARIIDGCTRGFGAGAGNVPLEVLAPILDRIGYRTDIDLYKVLDAAEVTDKELIMGVSNINSTTIVSGLAGVFSGFAKHVERVSIQYGVDPRDVFFELGRRKVVAGQEDLIIEVAMLLAEKKRK